VDFSHSETQTVGITLFLDSKNRHWDSVGRLSNCIFESRRVERPACVGRNAISCFARRSHARGSRDEAKGNNFLIFEGSSLKCERNVKSIGGKVSVKVGDGE
jgi:hypothetical protein